MPLRLTRANCVAVGTFNMYIVQPYWLAQQGIIPRGIEIALEAGLDEPGLRFSVTDHNMRWSVNPSRLIVESEDVKANCGGALAKVLEKLPYTPLAAVGNNFVFEGKVLAKPVLDALSAHRALSFPRGFREKEKGYHFVLMRGDYTFTLNLNIGQDRTILLVNVHADLRKHGADFGRTAANEFPNHRKVVCRLVERLFIRGRKE